MSKEDLIDKDDPGKCELCSATTNQYGDPWMFEIEDIPEGKIWVCGTSCAFSNLSKLPDVYSLEQVIDEILEEE